MLLNITETVLHRTQKRSVVHAESADIFKKRVDKFRSDREMICNYHAKIQGTGSRSVVN